MRPAKYTIGFSPCPNDTFIFDALINGKIDSDGIKFEPIMADVQTLNQWAIEGKLDITKLSFGVWPIVQHAYQLLNSGSALGTGVGPLLIADKVIEPSTINDLDIAIPGMHTTANLLFSMAYPQAKNKIYMRYDGIETFVQQGKGLGVIIHENRFTYANKGLIKIVDLGQYWEAETKLPIPLGGIVAKKNIPTNAISQISLLIKNSIAYAYEKYPYLSNYVTANAQEMSEEVMRKHIDLYVNDYSVQLGTKGHDAIKKLVSVFNLMIKPV